MSGFDRGDIYAVHKLREAKSHAERAQILLSLPDAITLEHADRLATVCAQARFQAGVDFLAVRVAAMQANRDAHGLLPRSIGIELDAWRVAFSEVAAAKGKSISKERAK